MRLEIFLDLLLNKEKVEYSSHVQNIGWQNYVNNGNTSGTVGKG